MDLFSKTNNIILIIECLRLTSFFSQSSSNICFESRDLAELAVESFPLGKYEFDVVKSCPTLKYGCFKHYNKSHIKILFFF
jgi:hypothetical protein